MKNYEKYAEEIKNYDGYNFCDDFIKPKIMKIKPEDYCVSDCGHCGMLQFVWLMEDYEEPKEPEVDWSKVEVDTPILVREKEYHFWTKRYFAKYEDGTVWSWFGGRTSWNETLMDKNNYAKLAETEGEE